LAYIARDQGAFSGALEILDEAKKRVNRSAPIYQFCIKGKMLLDAVYTQDSLNEFKYLQDKIIKAFDPYIVLSCANIYYEWSTRTRHNSGEQGNLLRRAMDKYLEVLEHDEQNVFAAMGVAVILAEHNKVPEALEILKGVREAAPAHI
jgi:hypothetical protein